MAQWKWSRYQGVVRVWCHGAHPRPTPKASSFILLCADVRAPAPPTLPLQFRPPPRPLPAPTQTFPRSTPREGRMQSDPFKAEEFATHGLKPSELPAHSEYIRAPAVAPRHELRELASGHLFQTHSHPTVGPPSVLSSSCLSTRHTPAPGPLHSPFSLPGPLSLLSPQ